MLALEPRVALVVEGNPRRRRWLEHAFVLVVGERVAASSLQVGTIDDAGVGIGERLFLLSVPEEEDRQPRRLADPFQLGLTAAVHKQSLCPIGLGARRLLGSGHRRDQRDAVALRNRLTETPPRVHRRRLFTIPSPARANFLITLAAARRLGTPYGGADGHGPLRHPGGATPASARGSRRFPRGSDPRQSPQRPPLRCPPPTVPARGGRRPRQSRLARFRPC